jgi:hypothetical protein
MDISFQPQESLSKSGIKQFYSDLSLWALIISNLIVIVWALIEGWQFAIVVWVYWSQSVAIGVKPTTDTKSHTAFFFLAHYGFFHLGYAFFLFIELKPVRVGPILFMAVLFLVYQCFSFFYNRKWEGKQKPNIGKMMSFPYARIIPMHIIILFGGILSGGKMTLALFMLLKTFADVIMHVVEKKGFGDKPEESKNQDS